MERKRLVQYLLLTCWIPILVGCSRDLDTSADICISFKGGFFSSKAMDPEETALNDISLMIFDSSGTPEETLWIERFDGSTFEISLLTGKEYRFLACANFGYRVTFDNIEDALEYRYHIAYPDEFHNGIPMTADTGLITIRDGSTVCIELERLMAKISLRMDRRLLSGDVDMKVRSIKVGNCPESVKAFGNSRVEDQDDCFPLGFYRGPDECTPLNELSEIGISKEVTVYVLENRQGRLGEYPVSDDSDKVIDRNDPRKDLCSYVEIGMDYISPEFKSTGNGLIYRFYLGEDRNSLDVERNCHYRISICPENDGLKEDSWRVDKENMVSTTPVTFKSWPESYISGEIGDRIHLGCTFTPSYAPFSIDTDLLEEDKSNGIYDFEIDNDGCGVTLTLTGPGRGLVYMEVGEPVNESSLWVVEVNLPD